MSRIRWANWLRISIVLLNELRLSIGWKACTVTLVPSPTVKSPATPACQPLRPYPALFGPSESNLHPKASSTLRLCLMHSHGHPSQARTVARPGTGREPRAPLGKPSRVGAWYSARTDGGTVAKLQDRRRGPHVRGGFQEQATAGASARPCLCCRSPCEAGWIRSGTTRRGTTPI